MKLNNHWWAIPSYKTGFNHFWPKWKSWFFGLTLREWVKSSITQIKWFDIKRQFLKMQKTQNIHGLSPQNHIQLYQWTSDIILEENVHVDQWWKWLTPSGIYLCSLGQKSYCSERFLCGWNHVLQNQSVSRSHQVYVPWYTQDHLVLPTSWVEVSFQGLLEHVFEKNPLHHHLCGAVVRMAP